MSSKSRILSQEDTEECHTWDIPLVEGMLGNNKLDRKSPRPVTAKQLANVQQQVYEEGLESGKKDGYAAGMEIARQATEEQTKVLLSIIELLNEPLSALDVDVEESLADLAILIAKQVIRREIKADPGEIVGVVRESVSLLPINTRQPRIHLNPEDEQIVKEALSLGDEERAWRLQADPLISRGGCLVETESSFIDATVEARLTAVISQMLGGSRNTDPEPTDNPNETPED